VPSTSKYTVPTSRMPPAPDPSPSTGPTRSLSSMASNVANTGPNV
jgi:hypothetical protein